MGDADLDSDSDRNGTGERAAAGRDATPPTDRLLRNDDDEAVEGEHLGDDVDIRDQTRQRRDQWR